MLAILVLLGAHPADAQDRLFIGTGQIGAFGRFGERIGPAPEPVYGQLVAGGRYVSTLMGAYDTSTGAFVPAPGGVVIGVDPRRPRLFMHNLAVVSVFDLEHQVSTPLIDSTGLATLVPAPARAQLAVDANALFVWHRAPGGGDEIAVVDLATRTVSRRFPVATVLGSFSDWRVTADGTRVFVTDGATVRLLDAMTGMAVASHPSGFGRIVDDRVNRRIYVLESGLLRAFDDALTPLGGIGLRTACAPLSAAFSHHTGRVYVVESDGGSQFYGIPIPSGSFSTSSTARPANGSTAARSPGAAGSARGIQSVQRASHRRDDGPRRATWTGGHGVRPRRRRSRGLTSATRLNFVLDGGLAPGRTDLTFSIGGSSPVIIPNAPPGTYYLRVRGTNAFGVSQPSNEVVLAVP